MQIQKLGFGILLLSGPVAGCNPHPSSSSDKPQMPPRTPLETAMTDTLGNTKLISYELTENSCATQKRHFLDQQEMCWSLQLSENNNSCALSSRQALFKASCPGETWNEKSALDQLYSSAMSVECYLQEGRPSLSDISSKRKFVLKQKTLSGAMVLKHVNTTAIIKQSLVAGNYTLELALYDARGNGLKKETGTFKTAPDSYSVSAPETEHAPELTCIPTLRTRR